MKEEPVKKIYIAGFDVFKPDAIAIGKEYSQLCTLYGFEGLYPLDNEISFTGDKKTIAKDIFLANKNLIDTADIVIANLNSFRGKEPDSGTVWECGYASALGKDVYIYMEDDRAYIEKFEPSEKKESSNGVIDLEGMSIEDFDYPVNLMLACSAKKIIKGGFEDVLKYLT